MSRKHGVILMSAILPTTGHIDLIRFAADHGSLYGCEAIHVIVNTRSKEPYFDRRAAWIIDTLRMQPPFSVGNIPIHVYDDLDDTAPQNPEDHPNFWNFWAGKIWATVNESTRGYAADVDYVIYASEAYGATLAMHLEGTFVPFDVDRSLNDARGTTVRTNILKQWGAIAQGARRGLVTRVTLFGQESVGKTTLTRNAGDFMYTETAHEYARPYLETVGADLTPDKMENIFCGQLAIQNLLFRDPVKPCQFLDTDILSTYGYFKLKGIPMPEYVKQKVKENLADLYILCRDDIEFETDPLRYGGDRRESSMEFWIDVLKEFDAPYLVMSEGLGRESKTVFVVDSAFDVVRKKTDPLRNFKRD